MLYLWSRRFSGTNAEAKCSFSHNLKIGMCQESLLSVLPERQRNHGYHVPYLVPDLYVARMWKAVNLYVNFRTNPTGPISENFQPLLLSIVQND
jgi:hypothetical protein